MSRRKAIIFARVSTRRQEQEGLSLQDVQLPRMRAYAKDKGFDVVQEFVLQETADSKMRVKFNEMVAFVKANKDVEVVLAFRVNRITRNYRDAVAMDELRVDFNKELHFVESGLIIHRSSRSSDVTRWDMEVFLAKQAINQLKEDARNTRYVKFEAGELPWTAPYGYKNVRLTKRLSDVIPEQFESGIVRQVFVLYASDAYSIEQLVTKLNHDHGAKLSKSNLHKMLSNKFYVGQIYDKETDQCYPHHYKQFISTDLFDAVQNILSGRSKKKFKYKGLPFAYRGLLNCADCGCQITPEHKRNVKVSGKVWEYDYYHCTERRRKHGAAWLEEKELTAQFKDLFRSIKVPAEEVERITASLANSHEGKKQFIESQLRKEQDAYNQAQKRIEKNYDNWTDGSITQAEHDLHAVRYRKLQDETLERQKRLQRVDENYYVTASYLLNLAERADALFDAANPEEKRQLIGLVCQNRQLDGKKLKYNLKAPFDTIAACAVRSQWRRLEDMFRNRLIQFDTNLDVVQLILNQKSAFLPAQLTPST